MFAQLGRIPLLWGYGGASSISSRVGRAPDPLPYYSSLADYKFPYNQGTRKYLKSLEFYPHQCRLSLSYPLSFGQKCNTSTSNPRDVMAEIRTPPRLQKNTHFPCPFSTGKKSCWWASPFGLAFSNLLAFCSMFVSSCLITLFLFCLLFCFHYHSWDSSKSVGLISPRSTPPFHL